MKADEYMVLEMAVADGITNGIIRVFPDFDFDSPGTTDLHKIESILSDAVMDAVLTWFHIERPWVRESDV